MSHLLSQLTQALQMAEIDVHLLEHSSENPLAQILVSLSEEPEVHLQIYDPAALYADQPTYQALAPAADFQGLVFYWGLDLVLNRQRYLESYQLLAFINQLLPLGAFELNLNDSEIYFRYVLMFDTEQADPELVALIVDKLAFLLPRLGEVIYQQHHSSLSLAELIESSLAQLQSV